MERYDLVIIGAGPGGVAAAKAAALGGLSVALVDKADLMGYGLRGAYKSKALWEIAREHHVMQRRWQLSLSQLAADLAKFSARSIAGAARIREVHRQQLEALGVTLVVGRGRFTGPHTIDVDGRELTADRAMIATGTRPRLFGGLVADGKHVMTSDEIVYRREKPRSMVVLGAGVIGCEFASIYAALGVDVTLLDTRPRILSHDDEDISALLSRSFERLGVTVRPSARCGTVSVQGDQVITELCDGEIITSESLLLAIGRLPNTEQLGLEAAGVGTDARGYVPVNADMRTNIEHIYAIGDVGLRPTDLDLCLVHVAEAEARRAIGHVLGEAAPLNTHHVPFIVFTLPMVAGAGLGEAAARESFGDVRVGKFANMRNHRAHARGARSGFVKLIVGPEGDDRVLGVRAVGDGVDTVVGEAALLIENGLPYTYLLSAVHAHPSLSESLHGAAQLIDHHAFPYQAGEEHCDDYVTLV